MADVDCTQCESNVKAITLRPLTQFQRRLLEWLQARRHLPNGIHHHTAAIARRFGCSTRYVQLGLQVLRERGLISREWDYDRPSRRTFRVEEVPKNAAQCGDPPKSSAPMSSGPPDPPISKRTKDDEDPRPPSSSSRSIATPPEIVTIPAELETAAAPILGTGPVVATWLAAKCQEYGPDLVHYVLLSAAGRKIRTPYAYFEAAFKRRLAEGGVPPAPPARPKPTSPLPPTYETPHRPTTDADVATWREWSRSPIGWQQRWGQTLLEAYELEQTQARDKPVPETPDARNPELCRVRTAVLRTTG